MKFEGRGPNSIDHRTFGPLGFGLSPSFRSALDSETFWEWNASE
jgi:hypothetical protein